MLLSQQKHIEDIIIEILAQRPSIKGPDLIILIKKIRPHTTKQAVYYALEKLIQSEIVVYAGKQYSIGNIWKLKVGKLLGMKDTELNVPLALKEGESISYKFPSLEVCDSFWAHIYTAFTDWMPKDQPIFIWNPHEWFIIGRNKVERQVLENFKIKEKKAFYSIRGNTSLDKEFRNREKHDYLSISTNSTSLFPDNLYVNVFGDFVIEVRLPNILAKEIDQFYQNTEKLGEKEVKYFENIISKKYSVKMKISRKKNKSDVIKKKIAKDFMIPKDMII